jgi:hypothetical protein
MRDKNENNYQTARHSTTNYIQQLEEWEQLSVLDQRWLMAHRPPLLLVAPVVVVVVVVVF